MPIKVFISYSHRDIKYKKELEKHLLGLERSGSIDTWTDSEILPGDEWNNAISKAMKEAQIILLLVSPDFISSKYCYEKEMTEAISRHKENKVKVIPIILRFCDWRNTPLGELQALPDGAKPIKTWHDQDEAYYSIAQGIKRSINNLVYSSTTQQQTFTSTDVQSEPPQVNLKHKKKTSKLILFFFSMSLFINHTLLVASYPKTFNGWYVFSLLLSIISVLIILNLSIKLLSRNPKLVTESERVRVWSLDFYSLLLLLSSLIIFIINHPTS